MSRFSFRLNLLMVPLVVSACGGGGSDLGGPLTTDVSNSAPTIGNTVASTNPVSPVLSNPPKEFETISTKSGIASCEIALSPMDFNSDAGFTFNQANQEQSFLAQLNHLRCLGGLSLISRNRQLDLAAQNHANFSLLNNSVVHDQVPGQPGFTGAEPGDRMAFAQFPSVAGTNAKGESVTQPNSWGEVVSKTGASSLEAFDGLTAAIYHRFVMLSAQFDEAGISLKTAANGTDMVTVVDFASTRNLQTSKTIHYPAAGQKNIPISFNSDYETPDPIPGAAFVGYPISVNSNRGSTLSITKFELRRASDNSVVDAFIRGKSNLAQVVSDVHLDSSEAFLAAKQILKPDTEYKVSFVGTVTEANSASKPVAIDWSFTTAPAQAIVQAETTKLTVGKFSRIKLSGCGSTYSWRYTAGLKATVVSSSWMQIQPIATGPQWVEVTDACGSAERVDFTVQ
jgi:uncharacterized protein YkwD